MKIERIIFLIILLIIISITFKTSITLANEMCWIPLKLKYYSYDEIKKSIRKEAMIQRWSQKHISEILNSIEKTYNGGALEVKFSFPRTFINQEHVNNISCTLIIFDKNYKEEIFRRDDIEGIPSYSLESTPYCSLCIKVWNCVLNIPIEKQVHFNEEEFNILIIDNVTSKRFEFYSTNGFVFSP